ncbi:transcriptional antiterminator [Jiella endophytica]|uniref:Transcriptional antiterminator n=1 Tax=Jiella endophytica TaxID=2558362 RepID=A0A4Y8RPW9_9HYPH|nr:ANTAR domain-containing protein [Jiella endophytica]TFF24824.1 transcriptional antiterminator [Jiella endophytica]
MSGFKRLELAGWQAVILHRPHPSVDALMRQLAMLHIDARLVWPQLDEADAGADVVFFDADSGHDGQFPWTAGLAPMPMIALVGTEAPGRIEWALSQGSTAHLLKPIGSSGAYSALLVAAHSHGVVRRKSDDIRHLEDRLQQRPAVVGAVLRLMQGGERDEAAAMKTLRSIAMTWRMTIEEAAETICRDDAPASRRGA